MRYLFLVTLGPVQEFIASARRTRDLHFGSWFLSELSRAAALEIIKKQGKLIFPAPENMEWLRPRQPFNVANRILAIVQQEPNELAASVLSAVKTQLSTIRDRAYTGISLPAQENAWKQIDDLIDLMWVALPYNEKDYQGTRLQVEALMAARKSTHDFQAVTWGDDVPKSSIDGQLESVIPKEDYPARYESDAQKLEKVRLLYRRYKAGPAEQLSGVDLLKRRGETAFSWHFPSTSHLAALPFLQRMEIMNRAGELPGLTTTWNTYIGIVRASAATPLDEHTANYYPAHPLLKDFDGSLLFEDRLPDVLNRPLSDKTRTTHLVKAKHALHDFYRQLDALCSKAHFNTARPSTYYALLQADGDGMGEVIDEQAKHGAEQHRRFSLALSDFAENVRALVAKHQGALIYAGGDDVLAFLPLHTVLQCASEVSTQFRSTLQHFHDKDGHPPTLSVGIAIVHHLDSLREARRLAEAAEKSAKASDGKNALAITVSKRGGEDYALKGTWGVIDPYLEQLVEYCMLDALPVGTAYELRDLARRLSVPPKDPQYATLQASGVTDYHKRPDVPPKDPQYATLQEVIQVDTMRILQRKLSVPTGKFPPKQIEEIKNFLQPRLATIPVPIDAFINELIIAQMLADARKLAAPKKEKEHDHLAH